MTDLLAALCLVLVLEGLLLFAAPRAWKEAASLLQGLADGRLRRIGAVMIVLGLACLYLVRAG
ncbi:MAG TPA: DUF2065 family protein [Arenimonas sp.]|jgi:uncharacterized protein YjeT (DUF2065 family)|nr:DUF2065 family protein [Arenimonas sp.]